MLRLARSALDHPRLWLGIILLITVALGSGLLRLELRTDGAALHPLGNQVIEDDKKATLAFDDRERVIVLVQADEAHRLDSVAGLSYSKFLSEGLGDLPQVDRDLMLSLAELFEVPEGIFKVRFRRYLDELPTTPEELAIVRERLSENPLITGMLLAPDGKTAALYLPLAIGYSHEELVSSIRAYIDSQPDTGYELLITGPSVAELELGEQVLLDLARLIPLMMGVIALLLLLCFGHVVGVAVPMLQTGLVLVWTLGLMGLVGAPVTIVTTIAPVVLMTIAILDDIHLLERIGSKLQAAPGVEHKATILSAVSEVRRPIELTSLTTAAGFLSFLSASMTPVRHFGIFTAFGILVALLLTFTLVPALIALLPPGWMKPSRFSPRASPKPPKNQSLALAAGILLLLAAIPALSLLDLQDAWVDNFEPEAELVRAERLYNQTFWGSYRFDLVLRSAEENYLFTRKGIELIDDIEEAAAAGPYVGGSAAYLLPMHLLAERFYDKERLAELDDQELRRVLAMVRLLSNNLDLSLFVTKDGRQARINLLIPSPDYKKGLELREFLRDTIAPMAEAGGLEMDMTSDLPIAVETVTAVVGNQLRSLGWTLLGVGLLLLIAFRDLRATFIVILPALGGALGVFALMGLLGIPLGIATSMFAALSIGVGVDFGLHLVHRYQYERSQGADHDDSVANTWAITGRAVSWNALVLSAGFLVLTLSSMPPNRRLGILLAAAVACCYLMTLLLLPKLMQKLKI